jgi:hypothetical protein
MTLKTHFHFYSRQGKLISRAYLGPESAAKSRAIASSVVAASGRGFDLLNSSLLHSELRA